MKANGLPFPGLDWLGAFLGAGLVFGGYLLEWFLGMEPCPFCLLERYLLAVLALVFLASAIHRPDLAGRRAYGAALLVPTGAGIAATIYHLRIQAGEAESACAATTANGSGTSLRVPDIEQSASWQDWLPSAPGSCTEVDTFLGISLVIWALGAFIAIGLTGSLIHLWGAPRE